MDEPQWLLWARELQAIAQTGLTFSQDNYDLDRYRRLRAIAVEMLAVGSNTALERVQGLFDQELGYPTPKVDVRAAVFRDDRILMVAGPMSINLPKNPSNVKSGKSPDMRCGQ
jgi:hypothetical protein